MFYVYGGNRNPKNLLGKFYTLQEGINLSDELSYFLPIIIYYEDENESILEKVYVTFDNEWYQIQN